MAASRVTYRSISFSSGERRTMLICLGNILGKAYSVKFVTKLSGKKTATVYFLGLELSLDTSTVVSLKPTRLNCKLEIGSAYQVYPFRDTCSGDRLQKWSI